MRREKSSVVSSATAIRRGEKQQHQNEDIAKELETLSGTVHDRIQFLKDYRPRKRGNVWIREYIRSVDQRHRSDHEDCARRLGCCALFCSCYDAQRRSPVGQDNAPGGPFLRMEREYQELAHCSDGCGCCVRRRKL